MANTSNDDRLPDGDKERLRAAVTDLGMAHVASALGVGKDAVTRCLAGLPVRRGTLVAVITGLDTLRAS